MTISREGSFESGKRQLDPDSRGSPVSAVRLHPSQAYVGISQLLGSVINESDSKAWDQIKQKIDFIYNNLDYCLRSLENETGFEAKVVSEVARGKKLLFKPNLVNPTNIDPVTHGEGLGNTACTEWPLMAALMRWFHDKLAISYCQMAIGEAATATSSTAAFYSLLYGVGKKITTEALIEGKSGSFYGGWGFYFARKYLAETHDVSHLDDPMSGHEESVSGRYIPPGQASNKLMVYDLNRLYDVEGKTRTVPVPDCANFKEITLPKVLVGGNPDDPKDLRNYPGCVLVNVPRLKMHSIDLLTNAIKNLGIGLYPMEVAENGKWKYAYPFTAIPGIKSEIPHSVWVPKMDEETGLPVRTEEGKYAVTRTGGMSATQADVIKAAQNQGVLMIHITDAIQAMNLNHTGDGTAIRVPEGFIFASLDPVALDLFCARYCLKNVPMAEAKKIQKEESFPTEFLQKVPVPHVDGGVIVNGEGHDSPFYGISSTSMLNPEGWADSDTMSSAGT